MPPGASPGKVFRKKGMVMFKCKWGRGRYVLQVFTLLIMAGCATYATYDVHREGMAFLEQGRYEEAVAKLEEAARQAPENKDYLKDFLQAREQVGNRYVSLGNDARAADRLDYAEEAYRQALRVDPGNGRATVGLEAVKMDRRHAAVVAAAEDLFKKGDLEGASARLKEVFLENPNNNRALQAQRQINERMVKEFGASPALTANFRKPVTLQFRDANLRMVLESISKTTGINILLDKDVRADLRTTIFAQGMSVEDTINLILMQNQLEKKVLSDNTIFIYPNVPAKTKDYQDLKVRSFHLVYADVKQVQAMLKTILKTRDLYINEKTNSIIMRDTPDAIRLAEKMIADQDTAEPEIILEVEVLEITRNRLSQLGIRYPDQLTLTTPTGAANAAGAAAGGLTLGELRDAWGSSAARNGLLVTPIPSVTLNAHLDMTNANLLASPRIRVRNRDKAKILIGDRVPVLTNSVTPVSTGAPVVTGSVSYIDVGLKLDVEPDIHSDGEVGIKVSMEVSNIVSQVTNTVSGTVAYQIGTRTASTVLRLKDGETQVLAGLIQDNDTRTMNGIPGLGQLPVLGRLFSSHGINGQKTEIVMSITPRLVGRTSPQSAQSMEYWSGTESNLRSTPVTLRTGSVTMVPGAGAAQPAQTTPLPPRQVGQPQPTPAVAQPMSFNWQGPAQAKVGERFTVTLYAQASEAVRNLGLQLNYDSSTLRAVDAIEGTFLKQQNVPSTFTRDINQPGGQVSIELAGTGEQGARGSGSVAAVTFEVIGPSTQSEITVARAAPSGISGQTLPIVPPVPHTVVLNP
jgi:general secretion pathway protein D